MLFFTAQGANTVGRINPKTGRVDYLHRPVEPPYAAVGLRE